jgi:hypothetical protein
MVWLKRKELNPSIYLCLAESFMTLCYLLSYVPRPRLGRPLMRVRAADLSHAVKD